MCIIKKPPDKHYTPKAYLKQREIIKTIVFETHLIPILKRSKSLFERISETVPIRYGK